MSETCKTVAIKGEPSEGNPSGVVIINESDFDEGSMTKCDVPEADVPEAVDVVQPAKKRGKAVSPWADAKEVT